VTFAYAQPLPDPRPARPKACLRPECPSPSAAGFASPYWERAAASRDCIETFPLATRIAPHCDRALLSGANHWTIKKVSENELASFFQDLRRHGRPDRIDALRSDIDFERKQDLSPVTIADRAIEQDCGDLFRSFPRAWHPRRGNRSTPGDRLYCISTDRRDQELSFRNAAVRYLDCSCG